MENYQKIKEKIQLLTKDFSIDRKVFKTVSYSQFSLYSTCNHKWKLLYVDKAPKQVGSINLFFGTSVHNTIQYYLTVFHEQGPDVADEIDLDELFENEFIKAYKSVKEQFPNDKITTKAEMNKFFSQGIDIVYYVINNKFSIFGDPRYVHLIGCEVPLFGELIQNVYFEGYIDLLFYNEAIGKYFIIDLKTSGKGWSNWDKKDTKKLGQLLLYKKLFSDLFNVPLNKIWVSFAILKREFKTEQEIYEPFQILSDETQCYSVYNSLIEMIEENYDEDGNKYNTKKQKNKTKFSCNFCHFKETTYCP